MQSGGRGRTIPPATNANPANPSIAHVMSVWSDSMKIPAAPMREARVPRPPVKAA